MNKQPLPKEWVERIFMRLHGRFGNEFLNKFKTGDVVNGSDVGIENAKLTWADELSGVSAERIKNALDTKFEKAPSCDMFLLACKSTPDAHKDFIALPKSTISAEKVEENLNKIKDITEQIKPKTDYKKWAKDILANPKAYPDISVRFAKERL